MSKTAHAPRVLVLIAYSISVCLWLAPLSAPAAESAAVVNKEVAKALTEAKERSSKKQWDAALAALSRADRAPDKTPYAEYKIDEFRAYVLTQQRNYPQAAAIFEKIAASEQAPKDQRARHLKTAAQLYMEGRQYDAAARAATSALKATPGDAALSEIAGEARYLAGQFKTAADMMERLVSSTEQRGAKPEEGWLQILLNSYYNLDAREQVADTWQRLVRHYPQPKYWENVLQLRTSTSLPEPIELGYYRLMFDLGLLKDPQDYEDLALAAIDAGVAGEAVRMVEWGFKNGIFTGQEAAFKRLLAHAQEEAAKSKARLPELAQAARRASTGHTSVTLGRAYLGDAQYDEAITVLEQGLKKGKVPDPDRVRVDLGIAYLRNEQPEQARETFSAVDADSQWHDLAELWSLRAGNQESADAVQSRR